MDLTISLLRKSDACSYLNLITALLPNNNLEQDKQNTYNICFIWPKNRGLYIGLLRTIYPKWPLQFLPSRPHVAHFGSLKTELPSRGSVDPECYIFMFLWFV